MLVDICSKRNLFPLCVKTLRLACLLLSVNIQANNLPAEKDHTNGNQLKREQYSSWRIAGGDSGQTHYSTDMPPATDPLGV